MGLRMKGSGFASSPLGLGLYASDAGIGRGFVNGEDNGGWTGYCATSDGRDSLLRAVSAHYHRRGDISDAEYIP